MTSNLQNSFSIILSIMLFMIFLSIIVLLIACSSKDFSYFKVVNDNNTMYIILFNFIFITLIGSSVIYYMSSNKT